MLQRYIDSFDLVVTDFKVMEKLNRGVLKIEICNSLSTVFSDVLSPENPEKVDLDSLDSKFWTYYGSMYFR